jgi:hypothetical protein
MLQVGPEPDDLNRLLILGCSVLIFKYRNGVNILGDGKRRAMCA